MDPDVLAKRLQEMSAGVAEYLHSTIERHGEWPARSFYGEAFGALLLGRAGPRFASSVARLKELYGKKDKHDPGFHWEFNNYAWLTMYREAGDEAARDFATPLRFRNTPVTNWTLLRSCTRYMAGTDTKSARRETAAVLRDRQQRSGLICDEPNVRSFQYHCFSAALVAEIHGMTGEALLLDRFRRAARFIERFVLRTGDALYIGRGQQQSFGYGALAYLLALAFRAFREARYLEALRRCVSFLERHRRLDGSFPLVLNGKEEGYSPFPPPACDPRFPGWYQYNNYFDYLPFLGVFLAKSADVLSGVVAPHAGVPSIVHGYSDPDFLVFRNELYEAVLSRCGGGWRGGGGTWANDLPFPYVIRGDERITPSFGGEQFGSILYSAAGIPLPAVERNGTRRLMRDGRLWSRLAGDRLIVLSRRAMLVRRFRFLADEILVDDVQLGLGRAYARYLFDEVQKIGERAFTIRGGTVLEFSIPMELQDCNEHYWGGRLQALVARQPSARCSVRMRLRGRS